MITLFTSLYDKKPYFRTVESILDLIKSKDNKSQTILRKIRASTDTTEIDNLKKTLPVICFGGEFKERKADALIKNSRLVILDFDKVTNLVAKKKELIVLPFIYACWVSPTGTGLKALVKVSSDNYVGHFKALSREITGIDESGKDICRACFMSYDEDLYVNAVAEVYNKVVEQAYTDEQKYEKLKKWLENKGERFATGSRNNFIHKLASSCNRFGLSKDFVIRAFQSEYCSNDFSTREMRTTVESAYRNIGDHGKASFDEAISETTVNEILDGGAATTKDMVYLKDVEDDLLRDFDEGTQVAGTVYLPSLDPIFRPLPGDLTVLTGIANHGKSEFIKQLDMFTAVKEGRKHCYFTPESFPPTFWYRELIRTYVGKPLEKGSPHRMTKEEYKRGMEFVQEHFYFVYPKTLPTPEYIIERFMEAIIKHGVKSVRLDPWNQLLHIMSKRDDIYLAEVLSSFERFAQQHDIHFTVVCHPNKTEKDGEGNYKCPDVYDLNGGSVWNARATNITVVHRPFWGVDKSDPTVEFHSKKIKRQMLSGLPGEARLTYDRKTGRYYDNGYNPLED